MFKLKSTQTDNDMDQGGLQALASEDTLLPTQMFPRLPARATFGADTSFVSGTQKMFRILFRNILCPQQMFPSLRSPRNIMGNKCVLVYQGLKNLELSHCFVTIILMLQEIFNNKFSPLTQCYPKLLIGKNQDQL